MSVPSVSYLEAMESGNYHRATQDEELQRAWTEDEDPVARALLRIAEVHRDAATGNAASAITSANEALAVLREDAEEGWTRDALVQHVQQCKEYLSMGKPLPDLPSGL